MAAPAKQTGNGSLGLWGIIGGVVLLLALAGQCSSDNGASNVSALMNASNAEMGNAIAAQEPPPAEPLSGAGVNRGAAHLRLAVDAEGFSGAMVYAQNCYDALSRTFSWARLDQCGAADMLAVRSIDSAETAALTSEAAFFESEAAAGRYLAAATGAGLPAAEADARLSGLQRRLARERIAGQPRAPPAEDAIVDLQSLANESANELMPEMAGE